METALENLEQAQDLLSSVEDKVLPSLPEKSMLANSR